MNNRAFLATITELKGGAYNRRIVVATFEGNEHPSGRNLRFRKEKTYVSAAWAFQITEGTYELYKKQDASKTNFFPENQDKIAVKIITASKALEDVKAVDIEKANPKLRSKWSSLQSD